MVSLDSDIFVMAEEPGLFASKITRFTVFFKLPFKRHDLYPSNRTHSPPSAESPAERQSTEPLLTRAVVRISFGPWRQNLLNAKS